MRIIHFVALMVVLAMGVAPMLFTFYAWAAAMPIAEYVASFDLVVEHALVFFCVFVTAVVIALWSDHFSYSFGD